MVEKLSEKEQIEKLVAHAMEYGAAGENFGPLRHRGEVLRLLHPVGDLEAGRIVVMESSGYPDGDGEYYVVYCSDTDSLSGVWVHHTMVESYNPSKERAVASLFSGRKARKLNVKGRAK